jgi:hypothetical protein
MMNGWEVMIGVVALFIDGAIDARGHADRETGKEEESEEEEAVGKESWLFQKC